MNLRFIFFAAIALMISNSCKKGSSYESTDSGLEYKYIIKSDSIKQVNPNEYLVLDVSYYSNKDSLLFTSVSVSSKFRMKFKGTEGKNNTQINEALGMMHVGDSISFKIDADDFYKNTKHDTCPKFLQGTQLRFEIALREIQTETQVKQIKTELTKNQKLQEIDILQNFLENNYPGYKPTKSGLYIIDMNSVSGPKPVVGSKVTINYIARFITGEVLDNTYIRKEPFTFTIGKKEVIEGLEEGVLNMKKGAKTILIIPSQLAYGEQGKRPVPPNTTLIFETELVSFK